MRVRVNFTMDVDADAYRDAVEEDISNEEVRARIQRDIMQDTAISLGDLSHDIVRRMTRR